MNRNIIRSALTACLAATLLLGAACGEDDKSTPDAGTLDANTQLDTQAPIPDGPQVEAVLFPDIGVDGPVVHNMGEGCERATDCQTGSPTCLLFRNDPNRGICTRQCTPDSSSTPLINEDDCEKDFVCGRFSLNNGGSANYCVKTCAPSLTTNPCPASSLQTCSPTSNRFAGTDQPVCWYSACTDDKECPVFSDTPCDKDADCTGVASDAFCRISSNRCVRPGNCTAGGICGDHGQGSTTSKVGDPCTRDDQCPSNGFCLRETTDSSIGTAYRNGYCTVRYCSFASDLPDFSCPTGSTCHRLFFGGLCFKSCDVADASTCRGNAGDVGGDYECYDWTRLNIAGTAVSSSPLCEAASRRECDSISSTLDCTSIGDSTNSTNMRCIDRFTGANRTDPRDSTGICGDDTASGAFGPAPDGGAADTGAADTGTDATADAASAADAGTD